jgi:hypothetical protein
VSERRKGKSKLVWDKEKQAIVRKTPQTSDITEPVKLSPYWFVEGEQKSNEIDAPTQNELPVYDAVTGVTSSRNAYVALLCAEKIQNLSRASEMRVCPAVEIIKKVIEENLAQFFGS